MLHTIVSMDDIFYQPPTPHKFSRVSAHCFVEIKQGTLQAIDSTDLKDYLTYQIGSNYTIAD